MASFQIMTSESTLNNAYKLAILRAFFLKLHLTVAFGEQRVITAYADIYTGMKPRTALTHNDVAGNNLLATVHFHAQAFTL